MSIIDSYKESSRKRKLERLKDNSSYLFQVKEHKGELWVTYNNELFAPYSIIKSAPEDVIVFLDKIRDIYISINL